MTDTPLPDAARLTEALTATWPAATLQTTGAWTIREGAGGGKRVSAATQNWPVTEADLPAAIAAMEALGQDPLFMVQDGEEGLDALLAAHGFDVTHPSNLWAIPARDLAGDGVMPMGSGYAMWPPLSLIRDIWTEGGIGDARQAVMERAPEPKAGLIGRAGDYPGGAAFVAIHDGIAMVHAIQVMEEQRRKGVAKRLLKHAAIWALAHGADVVGLAVVQGNTAANPLYAGLGMTLRGQYHYRIRPRETET